MNLDAMETADDTLVRLGEKLKKTLQRVCELGAVLTERRQAAAKRPGAAYSTRAAGTGYAQGPLFY